MKTVVGSKGVWTQQYGAQFVECITSSIGSMGFSAKASRPVSAQGRAAQDKFPKICSVLADIGATILLDSKVSCLSHSELVRVVYI